MKNTENPNEKLRALSEDELSQVVGGSVDWVRFSEEFHDAFVSGEIPATEATKELIEAIEAKDWSSVAVKAIPLTATNPTIAMIFYRCNTQD